MRSALQAADEPARCRVLHQPLAMPGNQNRSVARNLLSQPWMAEQYHQICSWQRLLQLRSILRTESCTTLPRPRLGIGKYHPAAATPECHAGIFQFPDDPCRRTGLIRSADVVVHQGHIEGLSQRPQETAAKRSGQKARRELVP